MRIMYIASNPDGASSLMLEQEIDELQRLFVQTRGEMVDFYFFPSLPIEIFPIQYAKIKPDILHISSHGQADKLLLSSQDGATIELTVRHIASFVRRFPPRLIFLSACNSRVIAESLCSVVSYAIGTTAPITNLAARSGAVAFYDAILQGASIQDAFEESRTVVHALANGGTDCELFGCGDRELALYQPPKIVARFHKDRYDSSDGSFYFDLGVIGCPPCTTQVIFFTDDETYAYDCLEYNMSTIVRYSPVNGEMWCDGTWQAYGDCRLFVCGVTADGCTFTAFSSIYNAVKEYFSADNTKIPDAAQSALKRLRKNDGSKLADRKTKSTNHKKDNKHSGTGKPG